MRNLTPLRPGDSVLVKLDDEKRWRIPATVVVQNATEHSCEISSPEGGMKRRNRRYLQLSPSESRADAEPIGALRNRDASIRYCGSVSALIQSFSADRVSIRRDRSKSDSVRLSL